MRCPECEEAFRVLESRFYDYTESLLGCHITGKWPKHTAKVYVDNIELLECDCGICVNIPDIEALHYTFFSEEPVIKSSAVHTSIDPYSNLIYVGLWDDVAQKWTLTSHRSN